MLQSVNETASRRRIPSADAESTDEPEGETIAILYNPANVLRCAAHTLPTGLRIVTLHLKNGFADHIPIAS